MSKTKIVLSHLVVALLVAGALFSYYSVQMAKADAFAKQERIKVLESQVNDLKALSPHIAK